VKFGEWMLLSITSGVMMPAVRWPITLTSANSTIGVEPSMIGLAASPQPLNGTRTQSAPSCFFSVSMNSTIGAPGVR